MYLWYLLQTLVICYKLLNFTDPVFTISTRVVPITKEIYSSVLRYLSRFKLIFYLKEIHDLLNLLNKFFILTY